MRFFGDTKSLDSANKRATSGLGKVDKKASGTSRTLGGLNKALVGMGLAVGAVEIGRWANDAGKMADTAQQAALSIEKALGPATQSFRDDLEANRKVMGLNRLEVDQLGAKMGLLFTGMGVGQEAAAGFGSSLVAIAGDLAAFRGDLGETPAALDAMQAALRGEFDPLEQFGVKLSSAKIEAEKLRLAGIDPMFAALSDGEQTMEAVVSLIQREAAPAMGALGDAMDTTAAKTNELKTETEDLQTDLGKVVNEVKGPLVSALTWGLRSFVDFFSTLGKNIAWTIIGIQIGIAKLRAKFAEWGEAIQGIVTAVVDAFLAIPRAIGAITGKVNSLASSIKSKIGGISSSIRGVLGFATGGTVPGPRGAPQMAMVHGGEKITTANGNQRGEGGGGGGPLIGSLTVHAGLASPDETARAIVDLLTQYNRNQGSIPIVVSEGIGT